MWDLVLLFTGGAIVGRNWQKIVKFTETRIKAIGKKKKGKGKS